MNDRRTEEPAARAAGSAAARVRRAWRTLPRERRLAAGAALGLFVTLFLPWYQETVIPTGAGRAGSGLPSASLTGWAAFSFVEAAVLLVAAGVLVLLFIRAEGAAFHVPGGDGGVITAAGLWTCLLIVWRMFDKQGTTGHGQFITTSGIEWGIFFALGVAALLAYAGSQIRLAHEPEPPLPGERPVARRREPSSQRADERGERIPRPVGADQPEAPTRPLAEPAPAPNVGRPPSRAESERRPGRGLDLSELEQIQFDDPPEAPTVRHRPASDDPSEQPTIRQRPPSDDPLTLRIDRPD